MPPPPYTWLMRTIDSLQSGVPLLLTSVTVSQPHAPGAVSVGLFGQPSLQSGVPSLSVSVSATPQPQAPGAVFNGSFGQPSLQSAVPSLSVSESATPQPHWPEFLAAWADENKE